MELHPLMSSAPAVEIAREFPPNAPDADADHEALRAAAQRFEALFLEQMLAEMRETVPEEGLMRGENEDIYRDMLDQELAGQMVAQHGYGLAEAILRQLSPAGGDRVSAADSPPAPDTGRALRAYRNVQAPHDL